MRTTVSLVSVVLVISGCVIEPTRSSKDDYAEIYRYAYTALQEGKWMKYRNLMQVVIHRSTASDAAPEKRAIFWYEYGRASGVVCDWIDAEFALTVASNLDAQTGGPVYKSFNELGRISVVRKQYQKAVDYFVRATEALGQFREKNPDWKMYNSLSNARVVEDFAFALEQTGGKQGDVKRLHDEAAEIRNEFAGKGGVYEDVTPYGTQCPAR